MLPERGRGEQLNPWASMRIVWAIITLAMSGVYAPVIIELIRAWRFDSYAGHGMLVPLCSAFLLWTERARIRAAAGRGDLSGILVILLGLGILVLGRWDESLLIRGLSIVIALAGIVVLGFGRRCLREAAFPIGFLLLMVPLPHPVADTLTIHLQRFAAGFAGVTLDALGIQAFHTDTLIMLPNLTLRVDEGCNGLRFLITLLTLMIPFAHGSQRDLARKILLVALTIPAAVLANGVRIAAIGIGAHSFGPQVAVGLVHNSIAKAIWGLTLLLLMGVGLLLRRGRDRGKAPGRVPEAAMVAPTGEAHQATRS